ncbi:GNAT family N-acetyltransferase [Fusibacter sp. JL298sf-3]
MNFNSVDMKRSADKRAEIERLLSDNFMEDPLYEYIFPREETRKACLSIFFKAYCRYLASTSSFMVSEDGHAVGVVYDPMLYKGGLVERFRQIRFAVEALPMVRYVGLTGYRRWFQAVSKMSSAWIERHFDAPVYRHLDLMVVSPSQRGKGYFRAWFDAVCAACPPEVVGLTLETQSAENQKRYAHMGFKTVETIDFREAQLTQYCMVYFVKNSNKNSLEYLQN